MLVNLRPHVYYYNIPSQVHVAAANTVHWDLFNADPDRLIRVVSIKQIPDVSIAVTGVVFAWKLARTTAIGVAGVAQTAWLPDLSQAVPPTLVTCRSKPTSGATEGVILYNYAIHSEETNAATILLASTGGLELIPICLSLDEERRGVFLRYGQGLRCVQITNSAEGNTGWIIGFSVE